MSNILSKNPSIYLLIFCLGGLVLGFQISGLIDAEPNQNNVDRYINISGLIFNSILTGYFFYCFVKLRKQKSLQ
jgi:hypothetical protein